MSRSGRVGRPGAGLPLGSPSHGCGVDAIVEEGYACTPSYGERYLSPRVCLASTSGGGRPAHGDARG